MEEIGWPDRVLTAKRLFWLDVHPCETIVSSQIGLKHCSNYASNFCALLGEQKIFPPEANRTPSFFCQTVSPKPTEQNPGKKLIKPSSIFGSNVLLVEKKKTMASVGHHHRHLVPLSSPVMNLVNMEIYLPATFLFFGVQSRERDSPGIRLMTGWTVFDGRSGRAELLPGVFRAKVDANRRKNANVNNLWKSSSVQGPTSCQNENNFKFSSNLLSIDLASFDS